MDQSFDYFHTVIIILNNYIPIVISFYMSIQLPCPMSMVAFGITLMLAQKQLHGIFESVILTNI